MPEAAGLELVVEQLDCADEAAQIEAAVGRLAGVIEVRPSVGSRKVVVHYQPDRIGPADIQAAIERLGMTVRHGG
ncbi:MAG TPA: heavy-metal-associated domain-containing protein, partial [Methylomirabilota bacterium]|nr:heavy-metal-associated domain-containing protein [Methylomirabilota bacterium]